MTCHQYRTILFFLLFALSSDVIFGQSDVYSETKLKGLQKPVEILKDQWGVSHIYAETEEDLFFAQGYNAARDRLFQLEIWRRQATGTMAELLGERMLKHDIGARLLRFRGDMKAEMNHYHERGETIIPAFTKGINAYIRKVRDNPDLLPPEFRLLDFMPEEWTPDVVISRHQGIAFNVRQELNLARAVAAVGPEKVKDLVWFHPGEPDLVLDESIDASLLAEDILELYNEARRTVRFLPEDILPEYRPETTANRLFNADFSEDHGSVVLGENYDIGSNNWVVDGNLSESGYPLMANDPHRVVQAPALRYFVHLNGPGWNLAGGGEPSLPGISIGHNGFGAWGLTVFRLDSEDLYVYETNPDDPNLYRYGEEWEVMRIEETMIDVKDGEPVTVELKFTRHGPVIFEQPESNTAYALRLAWLEPGSAPYLASLRMAQAKSWEEFREACSYNNLPGENMVWADRDGNIGVQAAGIAPVRPNWSGLLPVPGDGRYEWAGYVLIRDLPNEYNPQRGFINTSNENLTSEDYPYRNAISWNWDDPYRGNRVKEVLQSGQVFNLQDMTALQHDVLSIPARTIIPLLRNLDHPDEKTESARAKLLNWDFKMEMNSVAAGIYMEWERLIREHISALYVPQEISEWIGMLQIKPTIDRLISPDGKFGDNPVEARNRLLLHLLETAVNNLTVRFGTDMKNWHYGQEEYKHVHLKHSMSGAVNEKLRQKFEVGPAPREGYRYTVNNTAYEDNQTHGGTFRIIVDTENFDRTLASNAPGQSGNPESPFYDNLFEEWAAGRYFPLFYSRDKVDSVTRYILRLVPQD